MREYIILCGNNFKFIIFGLSSGIIASYFSVYNNEYTGLIIQGDFSNEILYKLYKCSIYTIIFTSLRGAIFTYQQKNMNNEMRLQIYKRLLNQNSVFYEKTSITTLMEYINNDVRIVSNMISLYINVLSRSIINIIITLYLLYLISYKLCIFVLILIPIELIISKIYERTYKYLMTGIDELNKKLNELIHETITHISIIKSYGVEDVCNEKHYEINKEIAKYYYKESYLYGINAFINFNLPIVSMIIIIIYAKYMLLTKGLITFILHYKSLIQTIKDLINIKNEMTNEYKKPYNRIMDLLKTEEINGGEYIPKKNKIIPSIQFKNIDFKYYNSPNYIFKGFNFEIKANEKIAIIGSSGCGKSTIAKLIVGIITANNGIIRINNIDIREYNNKWLKSRIGYVAQESIIFSESIANNIAYGQKSYNIKDVKKAAKLANASEFIEKLKDKYETKIEGTELSSLSGGQKQRISIARALMKNPQIIIFDEATSALDPYCEEIVQKTIKKCFTKNKEATMIVIAHRKSALELANKIYKIEDGKIKEQK